MGHETPSHKAIRLEKMLADELGGCTSCVGAARAELEAAMNALERCAGHLLVVEMYPKDTSC